MWTILKYTLKDAKASLKSLNFFDVSIQGSKKKYSGRRGISLFKAFKHVPGPLGKIWYHDVVILLFGTYYRLALDDTCL